MEPTQDDVRSSAVFCPAGQRGGNLRCMRTSFAFLRRSLELTPQTFDSAGFDAELQPDARLLPVPAGQTLRPVLRHRGQSAAVWTSCGHLQAVAHVAS